MPKKLSHAIRIGLPLIVGLFTISGFSQASVMASPDKSINNTISEEVAYQTPAFVRKYVLTAKAPPTQKATKANTTKAQTPRPQKPTRPAPVPAGQVKGTRGGGAANPVSTTRGPRTTTQGQGTPGSGQTKSVSGTRVTNSTTQGQGTSDGSSLYQQLVLKPRPNGTRGTPNNQYTAPDGGNRYQLFSLKPVSGGTRGTPNNQYTAPGGDYGVFPNDGPGGPGGKNVKNGGSNYVTFQDGGNSNSSSIIPSNLDAFRQYISRNDTPSMKLTPSSGGGYDLLPVIQNPQSTRTNDAFRLSNVQNDPGQKTVRSQKAFKSASFNSKKTAAKVFDGGVVKAFKVRDFVNTGNVQTVSKQDWDNNLFGAKLGGGANSIAYKAKGEPSKVEKAVRLKTFNTGTQFEQSNESTITDQLAGQAILQKLRREIKSEGRTGRRDRHALFSVAEVEPPYLNVK